MTARQQPRPRANVIDLHEGSNVAQTMLCGDLRAAIGASIDRGLGLTWCDVLGALAIVTEEIHANRRRERFDDD